MFRPRLKLTDEWQEIPEGWAVDPPADFRMNIESGKNEARRLQRPKPKGGLFGKDNVINKLSRQREELLHVKRKKRTMNEAREGPVTRSMTRSSSRTKDAKPWSIALENKEESATVKPGERTLTESHIDKHFKTDDSTKTYDSLKTDYISLTETMSNTDKNFKVTKSLETDSTFKTKEPSRRDDTSLKVEPSKRYGTSLIAERNDDISQTHEPLKTDNTYQMHVDVQTVIYNPSKEDKKFTTHEISLADEQSKKDGNFLARKPSKSNEIFLQKLTKKDGTSQMLEDDETPLISYKKTDFQRLYNTNYNDQQTYAAEQSDKAEIDERLQVPVDNSSQKDELLKTNDTCKTDEVPLIRKKKKKKAKRLYHTDDTDIQIPYADQSNEPEIDERVLVPVDNSSQKDEPLQTNDTCKTGEVPLIRKKKKKKAKRLYHTDDTDIQIPYADQSNEPEIDERVLVPVDNSSQKDEPLQTNDTCKTDEVPLIRKKKKKKAKRLYHTDDTDIQIPYADQSNEPEIDERVLVPVDNSSQKDEPLKTNDTCKTDEVPLIRKKKKKKAKRLYHTDDTDIQIPYAEQSDEAEIDERLQVPVDNSSLKDEPFNTNDTCKTEKVPLIKKKKKKKAKRLYHTDNTDIQIIQIPDADKSVHDEKDDVSQTDFTFNEDGLQKRDDHSILDEPSKIEHTYEEDETNLVKRKKKKTKRKQRKNSNNQVPSETEELVNVSENEVSPKNKNNTAETCSSKFSFILSEEEYNSIRPHVTYYSDGKRKVRRMGRKWTEIFYSYVSKVNNGCVISCKTHRVRSEKFKQSTPFFQAKALCKGHSCTAKYLFVIQDDSDRKVYCTVEGNINHGGDEVIRRNISGTMRMDMATKIQQSNASQIFDENLLMSNKEQLSLGNFSEVPTPQVLRKIVSELYQKEYTHSNIMFELQLLKEADDLLNKPYIRDIGLDPFMLVLFSNEQLECMKQLSTARELDIYFDATGCTITNIQRQKRPYLYSLVIRLDDAGVPVSLADMVTTQHTIPRISFFLNLLKREVNCKGHTLHVRKVETDFSYALLQSSLQATNNMSVKTYLKKCFKCITAQECIDDVTIHHLCSTHMLQHCIRTINNKIARNIGKKKRRFILQCFAAAQNSSSLKQVSEIFRHMCFIFLSKQDNATTAASTDFLYDTFNKCLADDESFEDDNTDYQDQSQQENIEDITIREASPFTGIFEGVRVDVEKHLTEGGFTNSFYQPEIIDIMLKVYMPIVPLWTGIMLAEVYADGITRDSNWPVEHWFNHVKNDVIVTVRDRRPSIFTTKMKAATQARLILNKFPDAKKKKTKKGQLKRKQDDINLNCYEEVWKRKPNSKKNNTYHKMGKAKTSKTEHNVPLKNRYNLPKVMSWGGKLEHAQLVNTCTIDNGLTILHLFFNKHESFRNRLLSEDNKTFATLRSVLMLMEEQKFDEAKFVWVNSIESSNSRKTNDLFGDEFDYIMNVLNREWKSKTVSKCQNSNCNHPRIESKDCVGFTVSISARVDNVQELVEKWLFEEELCNATDENEPSKQCSGTRRIQRLITKSSPVLIIRVYEHNLNSNITIDDILGSKQIAVHGNIFKLAGVTMHRSGHYCAVVLYDEGIYWYDGLAGCLGDLPKNFSGEWFPIHALYCEI